MNINYLSSQVSNVTDQLNSLFEDIGTPCHEREKRESELLAALSKTLNNYVRQITAEKHNLEEEAQHIIKTIKQMEASLDDLKPAVDRKDDQIIITYPLMQCLKELKKKHLQISKLHKERFEEVKKLVQSLVSYSSYLEPSFVKITLPPTSPSASIPPTFDLSPKYIISLEKEFDRVFKEFNQRASTVKSLSESIILLWAELGTPQAQTDRKIVEHYRDSPEKLGLHEVDIAQLRLKLDKLIDERRKREKKLQDFSEQVESLWNKLRIDDEYRRSFLNSNRGCGTRQIDTYEYELTRLIELKRQNLDLFVEDARYKLQELWDSLYFSEEEMLEFTPAFSDVYTDALLEAHEQEITKLEALRIQCAPILVLLEKHRSLVKDRDDLQASSQDASRLLGRGQKGERRDPTRLLREEKMRKRISKELPKISNELKRDLEEWENEHGKPFLVHGERYLDQLLEESKIVPGPRSKTPAGPPISAKKIPKAGPLTGPISNTNLPQPSAACRAGAKTPAAKTTLKRDEAISTIKKSPSKIPARAPLSNLKNDSPQRNYVSSSVQKHGHALSTPLSQAPPPKMREIYMPPPNSRLDYRAESIISSGSLRQVTPEDTFYENSLKESQRLYVPPNYHSQACTYQKGVSTADFYSSRQTSSASNATISGSENWQTIEDESDPEDEITDAYYAKLCSVNGKRFNPSEYNSSSQLKKQKAAVDQPAIK
ncbi:Anaphase spindle elongation protein 1 [Erysiphe neolycopersici]|uniref:Anaphase spindle elongation protein 1 n=1 Tax=Erysiphe neolycopersici TaxID=212602 RepID=A0A420H7G4_9PEZI|nr:Anaphase spindle elongation protein 1 [Erysiphe neolycopersici]